MNLILKLCLYFSKASSQKVSGEEILIFFSNNIPDQEAKDIAKVRDFIKTRNLSRYLGVPLLHGR